LPLKIRWLPAGASFQILLAAEAKKNKTKQYLNLLKIRLVRRFCKMYFVQLSMNHKQKLDCSGGYVMLLGGDVDEGKFDGEISYNIMLTMKLDVIFWGCIVGSLQNPGISEDWQVSDQAIT
jgi:hypothetical protein